MLRRKNVNPQEENIIEFVDNNSYLVYGERASFPGKLKFVVRMHEEEDVDEDLREAKKINRLVKETFSEVKTNLHITKRSASLIVFI